jgi:hypothetical protein
MGFLSTAKAGQAWEPRVTPWEVCAAVVSGILVGSRVERRIEASLNVIREVQCSARAM